MKLLNLLRGLDHGEFREFEKFLQSPFFKASLVYLKFFRYLRKHHPAFELNKADLQAAYTRCFGNDSFSESKLYNIMSGLSRQVEAYLVVRKLTMPERNERFELLLVEALAERHLNGYFRDEAERQIGKITAQDILQLNDYQRLQQIHQTVYFDPDTPKFSSHNEHLELADQHLDLHYCLMKLRYAAEMKARARVLNLSYVMPMLPQLMEYCARQKLTENRPLLSMYYELVCFYLNSVDGHVFRKLQTQFMRDFEAFPQTEQAVLLRHLINNGIYLNTLGAKIETELLSLYRFAIERQMLLSGKRLTQGSFINIVNLASLCKEFEWARQFIQEYAGFLEDKVRQPSIGIAMTSWYYNQGMLDEAQECLTPEVYSTLTLEVLARGMMLKIAFDRYLKNGAEYHYLMSHLQSYEKYISAKQLADDKKEAELHWIRFVRKMAMLKFEHVEVPEMQKSKLKSKLDAMQPMVNIRWTLEKIETL